MKIIILWYKKPTIGAQEPNTQILLVNEPSPISYFIRKDFERV